MRALRTSPTAVFLMMLGSGTGLRQDTWATPARPTAASSRDSCSGAVAGWHACLLGHSPVLFHKILPTNNRIELLSAALESPGLLDHLWHSFEIVESRSDEHVRLRALSSARAEHMLVPSRSVTSNTCTPRHVDNVHAVSAHRNENNFC